MSAWSSSLRGAAACAAAVVVGAGPAAAEPQVYRLDPAHTWVHFEVQHFATSTTRGRFGPIDGAVELDAKSRRGEVSVQIPVASIDTGLKVFDARLRQPDLLAAEAHPVAYFVSRDVRFADGVPTELRGELTLRGVSQPLSLRAHRFSCRVHGEPLRETCGGDFEGTILRSSVGATFGLPFVADRVRILVQVEGWRSL